MVLTLLEGLVEVVARLNVFYSLLKRGVLVFYRIECLGVSEEDRISRRRYMLRWFAPWCARFSHRFVNGVECDLRLMFSVWNVKNIYFPTSAPVALSRQKRGNYEVK